MIKNIIHILEMTEQRYLDDGNLPAFLKSCLFLLFGFRLKILHYVLTGRCTHKTEDRVNLQWKCCKYWHGLQQQIGDHFSREVTGHLDGTMLRGYNKLTNMTFGSLKPKKPLAHS